VSLVNWVTILLVAVIAFTTYRAFRNGFVRELVSLCSVILAIPLAGALYDDMYPKIHPMVDNEPLAYLVSFLAILFGVVVAGQVAAHILKKGVSLLNFGAADQLAGGAFGLLKGILICQAVLIAFVLFPNPDLRGSIDDSPVARTMLDGAPLVLTILPGQFDRGLQAFLQGVDRVTNGSAGEQANRSP
jgi:membrane protein required for colicin V production